MIDEAGTQRRPRYTYPASMTWDQCQLAMQEDIRNVLEQVRDSQMLRCDVAHAIKSMAREMRKVRIAVEKLAGRKRCVECRRKAAAARRG